MIPSAHPRQIKQILKKSHEIDRYEEIVAGLPQKIITYGFDSKYDFYPENTFSRRLPASALPAIQNSGSVHD